MARKIPQEETDGAPPAPGGVVANYLYTLSYQLLLILVPLVTLPYVSRVIGSEGLGRYSFCFSILQYFLVFVYYGTNVWGGKAVAIAATREDTEELARTFWSNFVIKILSGILAGTAFVVFASFSKDPNKGILFLQSGFVLSATLDVAWFFVGIQNFKSVLFRNLLIKLSAVILIFALVRESAHLGRYVAILAGSELLGQISLFFFLPRSVRKPDLRISRTVYDLRKAFPLFITQGLQLVYGSMDKTILGLSSSAADLGCYDVSQKVARIALTAVTSMGVVLLPKLSAMHSGDDAEAFGKQAEKSFVFCFSLAFPISAGLFGISTSLVPWFLGEGFASVAVLLKILSFSVVLMAINNVIGFQILVATDREKKYLASLVAGTALNLIANWLLVPRFQSIGSAVALILSELAILAVGLTGGNLRLDVRSILLEAGKSLLASFLMLAMILFLSSWLPGKPWSTVILILTGMGSYAVSMVVLKSRIAAAIVAKARTLSVRPGKPD